MFWPCDEFECAFGITPSDDRAVGLHGGEDFAKDAYQILGGRCFAHAAFGKLIAQKLTRTAGGWVAEHDRKDCDASVAEFFNLGVDPLTLVAAAAWLGWFPIGEQQHILATPRLPDILEDLNCALHPQIDPGITTREIVIRRLQRFDQAAAIFTSPHWLQRASIANPFGEIVKADHRHAIIIVG